MNILELGNPDSGAFRVRLLRRGEPYGPHHELVFDRDEPVLEFYGPASAGEQPGESKLLGRYVASQFRHPRRGWSRVDGGYGVSPANARDIAAWLERELSRPWTPPSGPKPEAQVITDRPVRLHQAGERRATIYVREDDGYRKEEAEWVEVSRRLDGRYVIGYLPRPGQRDAYGRRRRIGHEALEMVFRSRPPLIIFLGWDHPDLQTQMPPEEHSFQSGQQTVSYTVREGVSIVSREYRERPENVAKRLGLQQMFDSELDRYLATYPLTHILLDLRAEPSPKGTEPAAPSDQLVLDATGVRDLDAEVAQTAPQAPAVFVSYHHGGDAAARDRFERENGSVIRSSSIYPGEISRGPEVRREIRKRIVGCHYVVVLVGRETYTRRWVDWEIHAALTRDRGGAPRPVVGILLPEMSTTGALLQFLLVKPSPRTTAGELLRLSDELSRALVAETGATLPARLLDSLLTGYAMLVPWPASQTALLDALASSVGRTRPVNGRRLLRQNLPMSVSSPPVPGPEPEQAEAPQRELVTVAGPGEFPAGDRSAWLVSALQSYGPEEVLAALCAKGDAESAKLGSALRRHAHVLEPLDSGTSMAATLVTRLVAGDALSAMRNGLTALTRGPHLAATAQLPDVTPGTLKRILAQLAKNAGFRGQRIVADPNGGWIATGSEGLIEVWEVFEGSRLHRFDGMWGEVEDLIVDRNGNWLAATDDINFVRVWSIPSGGLLLEKFAGQYGTGVLAADPAGRWLAAGGSRDVSVWDIGTGARLHKLDTGGIRPRVLIFGPQGQWLCCVGEEFRKIRIWPMPAGEPARDLIDRTKDFWIQYLAVDPTGHWLATAGRGAVRVWDIGTGERLHALVPPGGSLDAFEVGPQAQWLYCAGSSGAVRLSPPPAGQPAAKPANRSKAKNKWAEEHFADAVGRELVSSDQAGRWVIRQHISIWDPAAPPPPSRYFPQFLGPVTALTADADGSWYSYAIEGDDGIRVHDVTTGTERRMMAASASSPGRGAGAVLQADPRGTWLASAVDDGIVRIWDPRNGTERFKLPSWVRQTPAGVGIQFATEADGRWLACSGDNPEIAIWSPVTGQRLNTLSVPDGSVRAMIADPLGTWVASGGLNGPVRLWRPDGSRPYQVLKGHDGAVQALAAGPLGHLLLSAGEDATIRLWDPAGDVNSIFTVPAPASQLIVSPNGSWFASASGDATIRIWNSRESTQHHTVVESNAKVTAINPDPAGRYLASIAADSTVSIWEPVTGRVIASLRVGGTPTRIVWTSGHLIIGSDQGAYLLELHG